MHVDRRKIISDFDFQKDRRSYSTELKAQVALAAIRGDKSYAELAMEFAVHPNMISLWRQQLINNINRVFDNETAPVAIYPKAVDNRHAKIGQLMAQNDFLTKVLGK